MDFFRFIFIFIVTSFILYGTVYEDAEDSKTSRWKLLNSNSATSIINVQDMDKKSRIIEFKGEGTQYTYELKVKEQKVNKHEYWLSWEMKFWEDFVIIVVFNTNLGERYLIYTPGTKNSYMQYALGDESTNGEWQIVRRNIQEDVSYFDNRVKVISFKSFVVKGNGKIDNIVTRKLKLIKKKLLSPKKKKQKKKKKQSLKRPINSLPMITVFGKRLIHLNLDESYVEEGISAYDKEDGEINVVSMENIDTHQEGRYMVLYMATDSDGNMALDKRYVHVGDVEIDELSITFDEEREEETEEINEEDSEEENDFSDEVEQIKIWEKELELREKKLLQREKNRNKH